MPLIVWHTFILLVVKEEKQYSQWALNKLSVVLTSEVLQLGKCVHEIGWKVGKLGSIPKEDDFGGHNTGDRRDESAAVSGSRQTRQVKSRGSQWEVEKDWQERQKGRRRQAAYASFLFAIGEQESIKKDRWSS